MAFRIRGIVLLGACLSLVLAAGLGRAQDKKNTAVVPTPKDRNRHNRYLEIAKKGHIDVVFLGDSITDLWGGEGHRGSAGTQVWKERFEPLHAVNFGIGADCTQHLLWRIENGELDGYKPKAVVLMIGTENLINNTDEEIAEGVKAVVEAIHKKQSEAKVLLLGIFPRGEKANNPLRARIKNINEMIAKLDDDGKTVKYLDIGDKFTQENGDLTKEIMPDFKGLSKKGYEIEADAIEKPLKELMK